MTALCNKTLCSSAGELFCIIPSYIANHLKKRLAARKFFQPFNFTDNFNPAAELQVCPPSATVAAFNRMKQEFDFNISVSLTVDLDANSSHSPQQVSQDIMEEVSSELHIFQELSELLAYGGLVLLVYSFLRSGRMAHFNLIISAYSPPVTAHHTA